MGIPIGFSVDTGWVWGSKSNPHSSPVSMHDVLMGASARVQKQLLAADAGGSVCTRLINLPATCTTGCGLA